MEENNNTTEVVTEQPVLTKKKKNMKGIIALVAIVLVLAGGLYFGYKKFFSPKSIFIKSVNKEYKKLEKYIDNFTLDNKEEKPILITSDLNFDINVDDSLLNDSSSKKIISEINKLGLKSQFGVDSKNMEVLIKLNALYDNKSLLNINGYYIDNSLFIELKDLYDKYIEVPVETTGMFDTSSMSMQDIDKDDLKYLLSKTKDMILNNLNEKDFKKSSDKVMINGKEVKATKLTYSFSEKSSYELAKGALNSMSKDSKYIKILAKLTEEKESAVKSNLKESIKSLKEVVKEGKLDKKVNVKFGILVKGITKKYVGFIFETVDGAKLVYYENGKNKEIRLSKENQDLIRVSTKDTKTVITLVSEGQEFDITVEKSIKGKKTIYDWDLSVKGAALNGKIIIDKVKENKDGTGETKITVEASMMGLITFKVEGDLKAEYVDKLPMPDTTNSIKAENISESDWAKIEQRLNNNDALQSFGNAFIQQQ